MEITNFEVTRGSAPIIRLSLTKQESIVGWTTALRLYDVPGGPIVWEYAGGPANSVDVPNALALGVFDVPLSAANTNAWKIAKTYHWTFERTNVGFEDILGKGSLNVVG